MAGRDSTLNESAIEQARWTVFEIAELARNAKRLSIDMVQMAGENDSLVALLVSNEVIAEKIGFLADLCSTKLTGSLIGGEAEEWLLPPAYHNAGRKSLDEPAIS